MTCPHTQLIRYWMNQLRLFSWKKYPTDSVTMARISKQSREQNRILGARQRASKAKKLEEYREKNRLNCREYYQQNKHKLKLKRCLSPTNIP